MRGSAQSAGSITHLSRGTVSAAGPYVRTGTKMSPDLPIPFLFLISQHAALSPPTTRKMTVTLALMCQIAAGQFPTQLSCPPTPQLTDPFPLCLQGKARRPGLPASTKMSSSQRGIIRKVWAWRLNKLGLRHCWSLASSVECDRAMEILYMAVRLTCLPVFHVQGGCTSFRLLVQDVGRSFKKLLRYSSFRKRANQHIHTYGRVWKHTQTLQHTLSTSPYRCMHFGTHSNKKCGPYPSDLHTYTQSIALGESYLWLHGLFLFYAASEVLLDETHMKQEFVLHNLYFGCHI